MTARIVIVADDDFDIRESIAEFLREEGRDVRVAQDGRVALGLLDALGDERCVLLLDLMMPTMSGFELLELLERAGRLPSLPVIVCSASKGQARIPSCVRYVIAKPLDVERLLSLLTTACAPPPPSELRLSARVGLDPARDDDAPRVATPVRRSSEQGR